MQEKCNSITGYFSCVTWGNFKKTKQKIIGTNFSVVLKLLGFITSKVIPLVWSTWEMCNSNLFFCQMDKYLKHTHKYSWKPPWPASGSHSTLQRKNRKLLINCLQELLPVGKIITRLVCWTVNFSSHYNMRRGITQVRIKSLTLI